MKFQTLLGLMVLGAGILFAWSHLAGVGLETRHVRAESVSRELARTLLDYRHDTGNWPRNGAGDLDLEPLLGQGTDEKRILEAGAATTVPAVTGSPRDGKGPAKMWLREIPLDPWGNPYRAILGEGAVAVLSCGPDQILDTDLNRMWDRPGNINPADGDDVGYVLEFESPGDSR